MPARRRRAHAQVRMHTAIFASKAEAAARKPTSCLAAWRSRSGRHPRSHAVEKRMGRPTITIATLSTRRALRRARPAEADQELNSTRGEVDSGDWESLPATSDNVATSGGDGRGCKARPDADREEAIDLHES